MLNNLNIQKGPRKLAHYYCSSLSLYLSRTRLERMKGRLLVLLNSTGTEFTLTWKKKESCSKNERKWNHNKKAGIGFFATYVGHELWVGVCVTFSLNDDFIYVDETRSIKMARQPFDCPYKKYQMLILFPSEHLFTYGGNWKLANALAVVKSD
jgi:hypothetical protein